jgi:SAM-dependent methyltransferase
MLPISQLLGEIHGIDVSDEMISLAREHFRDVPSAHLHYGSGSDLAPFSSEFFDLVYSFAVFQHIPSTAVVTRYLEESARVLKPGGVLCCQLRGAASPASTTAGESETWVGCVYPASDAIALCRRIGLNLLQITGASTQYMWVVARKPLAARAPLISVDDAVLKAVTPTDNPYGVISPTGLGAAFHCWLEGFPELTSLDDIEVTLGGSPADCCYISDHLGRGGFQLNVLVPPGTECGSHPIRLWWHSRAVREEQIVLVSEYPKGMPAIEEVIDGVDLLTEFVTTSGSLKVFLRGIPDATQVSISIDSQPVETVAPRLCDRHLSIYEFTVMAPDRLPSGVHSLTAATPRWSETVQVISHVSDI